MAWAADPAEQTYLLYHYEAFTDGGHPAIGTAISLRDERHAKTEEQAMDNL